MALYVETDYWVEGYAEGDTVAAAEPRQLQLIASLSTPPSLSAVYTPSSSYDASLDTATSSYEAT